ncbi:SRPBCC domain-containing protein [Sphingomonas lycopersici]|uniref:SRPBCC domain-containing protein n=1 Tax=Sphingomonas lycopersici TaxID=2951807 RepID=A0AA41ZDU6_9SPHN|nr:SRPBCC domain-containing protein [Sphingomonas lycopersici]MCW6534776.1 SRPBCC domain-containing protein [Sphingomonas lycopersici]
MRDGEDPRTWFNPDAVVRSERVEIDAPAALIWEILTDLPRYGEWNPFCIAAESTLEMGAPVHMTLKSYTEPDATFPNCEYVCAFEPEKLLSWQLPYDDAWPYPARRDQIIEALGPARCAYHSTDAFLGDTGIHVMRFCGPWVKRAFDDTAQALKARAEAIHARRKEAATA